jgi:hypothetical protein
MRCKLHNDSKQIDDTEVQLSIVKPKRHVPISSLARVPLSKKGPSKRRLAGEEMALHFLCLTTLIIFISIVVDKVVVVMVIIDAAQFLPPLNLVILLTEKPI